MSPSLSNNPNEIPADATLAARISISIYGSDNPDPNNPMPIWYIDANTDIELGYEELAQHPEAFIAWISFVQDKFRTVKEDTNPIQPSHTDN